MYSYCAVTWDWFTRCHRTFTANRLWGGFFDQMGLGRRKGGNSGFFSKVELGGIINHGHTLNTICSFLDRQIIVIYIDVLMHIQNLSQYSSDFACRKHGFGESKRREMIGIRIRNSSSCVQTTFPSFKLHIMCASIKSFTDFPVNPENACLANKR